jgi:hypothetical protein
MVTLTRAVLAVGVLSVALLAYLVRAVLQWRRLSHVPGPFFASLSKAWMVKESLKGRQPISFKEVNAQYGETTHGAALPSVARSHESALMSSSPTTQRSCAG